jgi:hypothetical protein
MPAGFGLSGYARLILVPAGIAHLRRIPISLQRRGASERGIISCRRSVSLYNVVIFLVVLTIALLALIYWGGFKEESRNS